MSAIEQDRCLWGEKVAIGVATGTALVALTAAFVFFVPAAAAVLAPLSGMCAIAFALIGINTSSFGVMILAGIATCIALITAFVVH